MRHDSTIECVLYVKLRNRTCQGLDRQGQGQGQGLDLQGQGQGLTSLTSAEFLAVQDRCVPVSLTHSHAPEWLVSGYVGSCARRR